VDKSDNLLARAGDDLLLGLFSLSLFLSLLQTFLSVPPPNTLSPPPPHTETHINACKHAHFSFSHTHKFTHDFARTHARSHTCASTHTHTHTHTYTHMHTHSVSHAHTHTHTHKHTHKHIHTHTHTHTHTTINTPRYWSLCTLPPLSPLSPLFTRIYIVSSNCTFYPKRNEWSKP